MSGVRLNPEQQDLRDKIQKLLKKLMDDIQNDFNLSSDERRSLYAEMARTAHKLHMSLNPKPKHHRYMIENRGVSPEEEEFYKHIHPVEDLLKYLDDIHANDDPEDQTLDHDFTFSVYTRRWGHEDTYHITRNEQGWHVRFNSYNEQGDKRGNPILYKILDHDSVSYPRDLPGFMEWLWVQAKEQGLSHEEVQKALDDLAEWISICERSVPRGIFRGYK